MSTKLTKNLKLRINSGLTADAKYNLERIDLLGSTFTTDATNAVNIRSQTDITVEPQSTAAGGSGVGGSLLIGSSLHSLTQIQAWTDSFFLASPLSMLDQAAGGTKNLNLRYRSDRSGATDTGADRTLDIDLEGGDRALILGGDLQLEGGSLKLTSPGTASLIVPATGTLSTLSGIETLSNKTLASASVSGTGANHVLINDGSASLSSEAQLAVSRGGTGAGTAAAALSNLLPDQTGNAGKVLHTDGTSAIWSAIGSGTVTSVGLTAPVEFVVDDSPVTFSGSLSFSKAFQGANTVWAGPTTGASAAPAFRSLVVADIPGGISHSGLSNRGNDDHTQYHTDSRALTWLGTRSTSDLPEGSNLYFTTARFNSNFTTQLATKTTSNLAEGSNLYFTTARVNTALSAFKASATWTSVDGTTKTVTHSLGTTDVSVTIYNIDTGEGILVDSISRTKSSTISLSSSQAPTGSGWQILLNA